ncbi:hypothetical protein [Streptacidiphilus monticola]|uniref:Uncharacterized protein n=1 Tax=Streptacidiphilus monticola TaxID=2161674 RepID=A0ABW1GD79_9ACTN
MPLTHTPAEQAARTAWAAARQTAGDAAVTYLRTALPALTPTDTQELGLVITSWDVPDGSAGTARITDACVVDLRAERLAPAVAQELVNLLLTDGEDTQGEYTIEDPTPDGSIAEIEDGNGVFHELAVETDGTARVAVGELTVPLAHRILAHLAAPPAQ